HTRSAAIADNHVSRSARRRQPHHEARATDRRRADLDAALVLLDDVAHDRQAEPGALAVGLGGEERLEDALAILGRDARPGVLDLYDQVMIAVGAGAHDDA